MLMKKVLLATLIATGAIGAVALPPAALAAVNFSVQIAPPALRYEEVPVQRQGYTWAPGYWDYRNNNHVWVRGSSVRDRNGYAYTPHRWVENNGRWGQERGHWDRR